MKYLNKPLILLIAILTTAICQADTATPRSKNWSGKMQAMFNDVMNLLPYVYSAKAFLAPANDAAIKQNIQHLAKNIHTIPPAMAQKVMGSDPIIGYSLDRLHTDINRVNRAYNEGNKPLARNMLRETISNCFSCHSTAQLGPEYTLSEKKFAALKLEPTEYADLYVATRQFDKALATLAEIYDKPGSFYDNPYDYEMGLQKYMAIAVRVKNDPKSAIHLIEQFRKLKDIPFYLQHNTRYWEASLQNWQLGIPANQSALDQAQTIVDEAEHLSDSYGDQAGNIEFLRATAVLHSNLKELKSDDQRAKAYRLLGLSYEALPDLGLWNLPDLYYESCIKASPRSELAKHCYTDLERSVIAEYSGSGGVFLTAEEKKRLSDLRKQAGY